MPYCFRMASFIHFLFHRLAEIGEDFQNAAGAFKADHIHYEVFPLLLILLHIKPASFSSFAFMRPVAYGRAFFHSVTGK